MLQHQANAIGVFYVKCSLIDFLITNHLLEKKSKTRNSKANIEEL